MNIYFNLIIFRELSICFKSARWDHPERNIKSSKTSPPQILFE